MILDSGSEIYVWIGNEASQEEKEKAFKFAKVSRWLLLKWFPKNKPIANLLGPQTGFK